MTDPGRYGIVHARARVWVERLGEMPGVRVEPLAPSPLDGNGQLGRFGRGVRVTSPRPGTLPLLLLEREVPVHGADAPLAVLQVSLVRPEVTVATLPDCGCDACDSGSADLLRAIDEAVAHIVGGAFVVLRGSGWSAQWHPGGGGAQGRKGGFEEFRRLMDLCRRLAEGQDVRLPRDTEAFVGRSWLD